MNNNKWIEEFDEKFPVLVEKGTWKSEAMEPYGLDMKAELRAFISKLLKEAEARGYERGFDDGAAIEEDIHEFHEDPAKLTQQWVDAGKKIGATEELSRIKSLIEGVETASMIELALKNHIKGLLSNE